MQAKQGRKSRSASATAAASPSGFCQLRMSSLIAVAFAAVMLLLCLLVFNYQRAAHSPSQLSAESISVAEYQQLLERAHGLIKRYKQLRGNESFDSGKFAFKIPYSAQEPPSSQGGSLRQGQTGKGPDGKPAFSSRNKEVEDDDVDDAVVQTYPLMSSPRDAVMGMALNPDPTRLTVFVRSLKRVSTCSVILIINTPLDAKTKLLVREANVKLHMFDLNDLPSTIQSFHPSTLRWLLFRTYVKAHDNMRVLYNRIWIADLYQVYFQSDPFLFVNPNTPSFHVFSLASSTDLSKARSVRDWSALQLSECFPSLTEDAFSSYPLLTSDLIVGTTDIMLAYVHLMASVLSGDNRDKNLSSRLPSCQYAGVDQVVHNLLVYYQKVPKVTTWRAPSSPVLDAQDERVKIELKREPSSGGEGENLSRAAIYAYAQNADLHRQILVEVGEKVPSQTLQEAWKQEPACRNYEFKANVDLFKGRCDLTAASAGSTASSCCAICNNIPRCLSFTFSSGSCFLKACKGSASVQGDPLDRAVSGWKA